MPVKNGKGNGAALQEQAPMASPPSRMGEKAKDPCCCAGSHCGEFGRKLLMTFVGILLVYIIVYLGVLMRNNLKEYDYIGHMAKTERMINVGAQGKVTVKPDIAKVTMGMTNKAATVAEAQKQNTEVMNKLLDRVKAIGIATEDIQTTNYNIYPSYNWTEENGSVIDGYEVNQNVSIKVRDLSKANEVLGLAAEVGATNAGGLEFTVDDRDTYLAQARENALKKIAEKVKALSSSLGVRMTEVVSYNEYEVDQSGYMKDAMYGLGSASPSAAPTLESGTTEVLMQVDVTFAIK